MKKCDIEIHNYRLEYSHNVVFFLGKDATVLLIKAVVWIPQSAKILAHARQTDNIECCAGRPVPYLNNRFVYWFALNVVFYFTNHLDSLGSENGVEIFNVAKGEGRHQTLALCLR